MKPPCESCYRSGTSCVLVESRRGAQFARSRQAAAAKASSTPREMDMTEDDVVRPGRATSSGPAAKSSTQSDYCPFISEGEEDGYECVATDENLHMELRNPSDALEILEQTRGSSQRLGGSLSDRHSMPASTPSTIDRSSRLGGVGQVRVRPPDLPKAMVLDEYELIRRGLLHPAALPELLLMLVTHPDTRLSLLLTKEQVRSPLPSLLPHHPCLHVWIAGHDQDTAV